MDSTISRAGRTTHIKIVVVALVAAIAVVVGGINARMSDIARSPDGPVLKAGAPAAFAGHQTSEIR